MADQAFSFGCFHFGLREAPPPGFTVHAYMAEVERALKEVSNVDNVEIDCDPEFYDEELSFSDKPPRLRDGNGPFPNLPEGRVSFDLLIPQGLQEQLRMLHSSLYTFTERFRVDIYYVFESPVAVVRLIDPTNEPYPAEAVVIVRELLKREFRRQQQTIIDFQILGPSPFHANFFLSPKQDNQGDLWGFELSVQRTRGYDVYNFFYNETVFPDSDTALDELLQDVLDELDVYYLIIQDESQKIQRWSRLQTQLWSLVELHRQRGAKAFFARMVRAPRLLDEAFVLLAEFEGTSILSENGMRDSYRSTYVSATTPYLKEVVDRRMDERAVYPTEQTSTLLQLFETRRLSAAELRVILISAVAGGALGALVSVLLGSG